jgi:hypothetical protein
MGALQAPGIEAGIAVEWSIQRNGSDPVSFGQRSYPRTYPRAALPGYH